MDADTLRFILFIIGCFVILGIYLWDHYKRHEGGKLRIRLDKKRPPWNREEPGLSNSELHQAMDEEGDLDNLLLDPLELPEDRKGAKRAVPPKAGLRGKVRSVQKIQRGAQNPLPPEGAPEKILQLFVRARNGHFSGEDIFRVARQLGLRHGDMEIFHYHDPATPGDALVYSVASMVNPGTISVKGLADYETPGLAVFARLPAMKDGVKVFQDMLDAVAQLAENLNGEVLDENREELTRDKIELIRHQIIDHRQQVEAVIAGRR